jgi:GPH family glycoside/pentoside/hexuronide:cation symporter
MAALSRKALAAYAAVALPLAAAALPVHVHIPKFYAGLGLELALIGMLLLVVRLFDALSDPLLGALADRIPESRGGRRAMIVVAAPLLAAGLWLLFTPPSSNAVLAPWLALTLVLSYLGLSAASIAHFALGSALSRDYVERTRITAARGIAALTGVLLAATLPEWLVQRLGPNEGLAAFALAFAPLLLIAAAVTVVASPRPVASGQLRPFSVSVMLQPLRNRRFRCLALVFLVNGISAAVPATLLLFFAADVLQQPQHTPLFLVLYFVSGAAGMPLWTTLAARFGKVRAWQAGIMMAVAAFVWTWFLGAGDGVAFAAVCVLSGLAFGADLALPASLLADVIDDDEHAGRRPDGAYFGLWHLLEKLALALAAGIALPALQWLGYQPGTVTAAGSALSAVYALLPCLIKVVAALLLWGTVHEVRHDRLQGDPA